MRGDDACGNEAHADRFHETALAPLTVCHTQIDAPPLRGIPARHQLLARRVALQCLRDVVGRP